MDYQTQEQSWELWGKWQNFQNLPPSLSPFICQWLFITAEPCSLWGKGWGGNGHSLLPSVSGTVSDLASASHHRPAHWVPARRGGWKKESTCHDCTARAAAREDRQSRAWPENLSKVWEIKTVSPNLPFPLTYFGFPSCIRDLPQAGNTLPLRATGTQTHRWSQKWGWSWRLSKCETSKTALHNSAWERYLA